MAADGGRSLALHVCSLCKARKKKCDKQLPRCSYCVKGGYQCVYEPLSRHRTTPRQQQRLPVNVTATPSVNALSPAFTIPSSVSLSAANLYQQVYHLIRASGRFVDDVSTGYFHGLHLYIPIISRARFHDNFVTLGATPTIDFSALLLSLHLVTLAPPTPERHHQQSSPSHQSNSGHSNGGLNDTSDDQSVYLTTKSLFTQVQSSSPASIHLNLIQAGLLIAVYEYTRGQPDQAFMTISLCARLGYAARINQLVGSLSEPDHNTTRPQTREAANTWWGVVIYERSFQCEATIPHQPLIAPMPESDAELPTEAAIFEGREPERGAGLGLPGSGEQQQQQPAAQLAALEHTNVGAFGRSAQAAWLLDQVLKGTETPNLESRLPSLRGLDEKLRTFLSKLVQQANGKRGPVCQAIALTIRALYVLHRRILDRLAQLPISGDQSVQMNRQISRAALETTTNIVFDVVEAHGSSDSSLCLAPSYPYIVRAAVEYIEVAHGHSENRSRLEAAGRLRRSMEQQGSHFFS
ncbi:hypothetical protein PG985_013355 [Apiospora marii]|uniref:uncharacterized protein n=1 Tax=Apiospora marii TaxID=335849 RepID=UPI00312F8DEF